ncbi:MAG: 16S rRNA (uracil(1498)-N(3))-methyltransferase [Oceanospirillales bacterium]|nr:MAG: 16S rRNA (uracil(1498)-N(3))-methyltransferase [Oceanospirillales bacterium]
MNLILVEAGELKGQGFSDSVGRVRLTDRRADHIRDVHKAQVDDLLKVGLLNGSIGQGRVVSIDQEAVELALDFSSGHLAPEPLPVVLVLALPRPKMLRRILQASASMGVKEIWIIHSYRVDKSYWSSPLLDEESMLLQLKLGLEQAGDTLMPTIHLRKRFKPFVEDELPSLVQGRQAWVAHPYGSDATPTATDQPTLIAVGPEGGFIPYEVDKLKEAGLQPLTLGRRILRVETAIPVLLARLFPVS